MPDWDDYLPNDPNKGVPISELLKRHGGDFSAVVENKKWFDDSAKPKKKPLPESEFEPDPDIKDAEDGIV